MTYILISLAISSIVYLGSRGLRLALPAPRAKTPYSADDIARCLLNYRLALAEGPLPVATAEPVESLKESVTVFGDLSNISQDTHPAQVPVVKLFEGIANELSAKVQASFCFAVHFYDHHFELLRGGRLHAPLEMALERIFRVGALNSQFFQRGLFWRDLVLHTRTHENLLDLALLGIDTLIVRPVANFVDQKGSPLDGALVLCYAEGSIPATADLQWSNHLAEVLALRLAAIRQHQISRDAVSTTETTLSSPDLLSSISHDMRAPLANIGASIRVVLGMPELDDGIRQLLGGALYSCNRLSDQIDDILNLSQANCGKLEAHASLFNLATILIPLIESFRPQAYAKGLEIVVNNEKLQRSAWADAGHVIRIVANLLHNAIKFTERGQVELTADEADEGVIVAVSDTGPGLGDNYQAELFKPHSALSSGSGLGLAIAKMLAEHNGGSLKAESKQGEGSRFVLTLPRGKGQTGAVSEKDQITVLVVDDDYDNALSMSRLARAHGVETIAASSVAEARILLEFYDLKGLIVDYRLGANQNVFELIEEAVKLQKLSGVALVSGERNIKIPDEMRHLTPIIGIPLLKPATWEEIATRIGIEGKIQN